MMNRLLRTVSTALLLASGAPALASQQTIATGTATNDGTGDTIRAAFGKANQNFSQLFGALPLLPTPYLGNVVTGAGIPTNNSGSLAYQQVRAPVFTRDALASNVVVGVPCFWAGSAAASGEEHITTTATHKVTLEDTAGNLTPITFGGSRTGSCANAVNGVLQSDPVTMAAPIAGNNQIVYFKDLYTDLTAGIINLSTGANVENGAGYQYASSGSPLTDLSGIAGPIANTAPMTAQSGFTLLPLYIATLTRVRSFCNYGDSLEAGYLDYYEGRNANLGSIDRSIGQYAPTINIGLGGDRIAYVQASGAARVSLDAVCSDDVIEYGRNDINYDSQTSAQVQANLLAFRARLSPNHKAHLPTIEPLSSLAAQAASALVANGNVLTATVASSAYVLPGTTVTFSGATPTTDNGPCSVLSVPDATHFTCVSGTATGTATATGTVTYTDAFGSTIGQTTATTNAVLVANNTWKRGLLTGQLGTGFWSVPDMDANASSGFNSGRWRGVSSVPNRDLTQEGLHYNHAGYMWVPTTPVLSPTVLN